MYWNHINKIAPGAKVTFIVAPRGSGKTFFKERVRDDFKKGKPPAVIVREENIKKYAKYFR